MPPPLRPIRLRRAFPWLVGAAALFLLAGAVLMLPGVQRALLRRSLQESGATEVKLGEIRATPFGLEAERIEFTRGALHVDALGLRLAVRPFALLRRRLVVSGIAAEQLDVSWDLTAAATQAGPAPSSHPRIRPPPVFAGLLRGVRLPIATVIDGVDLTGRFTLLRGSAPVALTRWTVRGGRIAPGHAGSLDYVIETTSGMLPGGAVRLAGSLAANEGAAGELVALTLTGGSEAKAGPLATRPLRFGFKASLQPNGEAYAAHGSAGADLMAELSGGFDVHAQLLQTHLHLTAEPTLAGRLPLPPAWFKSGHAVQGSTDFAFKTEGVAWSLARGLARIEGGRSGAVASLALAQPMPLEMPSGSTPLAVLRLEHIPLAWANPWLTPYGCRLGDGELNGAWNLSLAGETLTLAATAPLTLAPLRFMGPRLPPTGSWRLEAAPRLEVSKAQARLVIEKLTLKDASGHRLEAATDLILGWSGARSLALNRCEVKVFGAGAATPALAVTLLQPFALDPSQWRSARERLPTGDLLRIGTQRLPLGWLSRWLPGRRIDGVMTGGETVIRGVSGQGIVLATPTPWHAEELRLTEGGRDYFHGSAQASPAGVYGPKERWFRLEELSAVDVGGRRLKGRIGAALRSGDARAGGAISLEAYLPRVPGLGGGPLRLRIFALAHAESVSKGELARFSLVAVNADGRQLAAISADQPILVERSPESEWLVNAAQPLRFATGQVSLAALNPLLASRGISLGGLIPATELWLHLTPRHLRLESKAPLAVREFRLDRDAGTLITRALVRFGGSLDLNLEHRLLPVFKMNGTAVIRLTDGLIAAEGSRVARFDGQVGVAANEHTVSLRDVAGSLWLDLGALGRMPVLARARLPAKGELTLSLRKNPDRAGSVQFDGKIDRVVGRAGQSAPALVITGRAGGNLSQKVAGFRVDVALQSAPRPSDLHFGMKVDFGKLAILDLASRLEGAFIDVDALRRFADAFAPVAAPPVVALPAPAPAAAPAAKAKGSASGAMTLAAARLRPAEGPPWGIVRGHFTLALKTVVMAPYTIENLGGRLDVTDDSLKLSQLSGDLLNGRWSADIAAQLRPGDPAGDKAFDAHFRLIQLDAGRAVRMRFPKPPAGIDGRLDLNVTLASRASRWEDLVSHASGNFTLEGHEGQMHLALPNAEMASSGLILGGTLTFSSELRALGRLVRSLSTMPINRVQASGTLAADGQLHLERIDLESPGMRIVGVGQIADAKSRDLMGQPLAMRATLAANGDMAVILAGMHLLGPAGPDGYRTMNQPFIVAGNVGQPDLHALYDLLARAAGDSHGTWGLLMRKVQAEAEKRRGKAK